MFLTLLLTLMMIMVYKIRYQDTIYYKYLYFYNCNDEICSTTNEKEIEDKSMIYSVYKYQKKTPTFTKLNSEYVKIYDRDKTVLYSMHDRIISNNYKDYEIIENDEPEFVATNENNMKGLINKKGNSISAFLFKEFGTYNKTLIACVNEEKYGIITLDGKKTFLEFEYDNIIIYDEFIITTKDNKINIIDENKNNLIENQIEIENQKNVIIEKKDNIIIIKENKNNEFNEYKFDTEKKALV